MTSLTYQETPKRRHNNNNKTNREDNSRHILSNKNRWKKKPSSCAAASIKGTLHWKECAELVQSEIQTVCSMGQHNLETQKLKYLTPQSCDATRGASVLPLEKLCCCLAPAPMHIHIEKSGGLRVYLLCCCRNAWVIAFCIHTLHVVYVSYHS